MRQNKHWGKEIPAGTKFGKLTVLQETEAHYWQKYRRRQFLCQCDCGKQITVWVANLENGHTQSCGCFKIERSHGRLTHGATHTRLHATWTNMLSRCRNPHNKGFKDYGGKGVRVCAEWLNFEVFQSWALTHGYQDNLTIERKDVFGNYEPSNCTWIPKSEQSRNRRSSKVNRDRLQVLCK